MSYATCNLLIFQTVLSLAEKKSQNSDLNS